jgi:hypothetical protein
MSQQRHARASMTPLYSFYRREVIDFEELLGIKSQGYKDITVVDAVQVRKSICLCLGYRKALYTTLCKD